MKQKKELVVYGIIIVLIVAIGTYFIYQNISTKNKLLENLLVDDIDTNVNLDNSDQNIIWSDYENREIALSKSITITEEGIYNLSGTIEDGGITINTTGNVKLVLNNVSITNSSGPAIYVEEAETVIIYLNDGTENDLEDGSTYTGYEEDVNGVIYSKDDLILDGEGTLTITANYQDGIVGKDDLKIINGTYNITSEDDGIRGKDSLYILDGTFTIHAGGDGLKSTNDTEEDKGYILIENGTFNIEAELDGIQAETKLVIQNGNFTIETGGGSSNASTSSSWGNWGRGPGQTTTTTIDTSSAKGLKSGDNLVIENGVFTLNTSDDSIHSNNYVGIKGGTFTITSGDDGIHADTELIIDAGNIDIKNSYEGIESAKITINNGTINVVSSDDGINVAGGNDSSSMNRPGQNNYSSNTNNILTINNGTIYVNASGDGIDINGSGYIYGGTITVDGPTDSANAALDYDGELVVNGGTLIAAGASGMAQGLSSNSTQYNVMINFGTTYASGKEVTIEDENGNTVISYTPSKSYSSIVISSSKLTKSSTYTVKVGGSTYTSFTISSISTTVGTGMMNGGVGGIGGNRR